METKISTDKQKERQATLSESSQESSPVSKRPKLESSSSLSEESEDEVMAAINSEGLAEKMDLILTKLNKLDVLEKKIDGIDTVLKGLQDSVAALENDVTSIKHKYKSLDNKFKEVEKSTTFVGNRVDELNKIILDETENRKTEISDVRKELLYLEAYSRRENLKFEGIAEQPQQANDDMREDTNAKLVDFMENVLGIEEAKEIEFQRVHRIGRPGLNGRPIIARFLRYSDRESVFKCGHKLKNTSFKMYEDIPKALHDLRKPQIKLLKKARSEGKKAYFSKSEPDKLFIDGKYIKL